MIKPKSAIARCLVIITDILSSFIALYLMEAMRKVMFPDIEIAMVARDQTIMQYLTNSLGSRGLLVGAMVVVFVDMSWYCAVLLQTNVGQNNVGHTHMTYWSPVPLWEINTFKLISTRSCPKIRLVRRYVHTTIK